MRSQWEALHAGLARSIEGREASRLFEDLRSRRPALAPFTNPAAVERVLAHDRGSLLERDRVLRELVEEVQSKGAGRRLAHALLLLGLWPGLDAVFRRRRRCFRSEVGDLETEIIDQFTAQVERIRLQRVTCLAATLVLNTEREVVDARIRERSYAAKCEGVTPDALPAPENADAPLKSVFGLPTDQSDADDIASLRRWLEQAVGRDVDLVVEAVFHGKSRLEIATALGISHAAARKRLERALGRAREALLLNRASQTATSSAFVS